MIDKNAIIEYYNKHTAYQVKTGVNKRHKTILKNLKVSAGLKPDHRVLEIGCGIGTVTYLMAKYLHKGKVTAIDISPECIKIAKNKLRKFNNIEILCGDIIQSSIPVMGLFDAVVLPDVLEHIDIKEHFDLFHKISQILKPDGFIFINMPNPQYTEWCAIHKPQLLQIVDQSIFISDIIKNISAHALYIHELKTYSIWIRDCDYQYIVLRKQRWENFKIQTEIDKPDIIDKIRFKFNEVFKR